MPFSRPTLSDLREEVMSDINATLFGANALLRKSVLSVLGTTMAGLAFLHYGYLDWIALQAVPWTATGEYLAAWGALKNVYQKQAVSAKLTAQYTGTPGTLISAGIKVMRTDGESYAIEESARVGADGTAVVTVQDTVAGAAGNCEPGTPLTLATTIAGIQSTGMVISTITPGVDTETEEAFGARVMAAFQETPHGGDREDYVRWALEVPGVTRAWCSPTGFGLGTVVVRFMMDAAQEMHGGFPQGTDGVSQFDQGPDNLPRDVVATGDQLTLVDAIINEQPVTALVFACAPIENQLHFTLSGLSASSVDTRNAIAAVVADVLFRNGDPRAGTIHRNDIDGAINSVPGTSGWLMVEVTGNVNGKVTTYPGDITGGMGELPTLGDITYV